MTQTQIDAIKLASTRFHTVLPQMHKIELKGAEDHLIELQAQCDHMLADGTSAFEGSMFCTSCKICGVSDL